MARFTDDYLLYLLAQASTEASAGFHARLDADGIRVSTWRILASLYPDAALGITDLAQSCLTKQSTMTRQVDRLVAEGLVARAPGGNDRRRVTVQLTPAGRTLAISLTERAKAHEASILSQLTKAQIKDLKAALTKLTGASRIDPNT